MEVSASMATTKPFSITSPDIARRSSRMKSVHIGLVVRDAAVTVAGRLVHPLQDAAKAAGASPEMVGAIKVHDGHLNELVMRDQGHRGDVIVGVDGISRHADEAEELEWGGLLDSPPRAWVRNTAQRHGRDVHTMWSNEMSRELDKAVGR